MNEHDVASAVLGTDAHQHRWFIDSRNPDAPWIVTRCGHCFVEDWKPRDQALFDEFGHDDSWHYSAIYSWRHPSRTSWLGYPAFLALSFREREKFQKELAAAKTYEEGSAIIKRTLKT